ncbi:MAG: hypothetical protein LVQ95_04385 [Candidatus Micrarchaeales archaeon]|nr:hypothetical protein [Candidatus Micrarchaeales archaeon]
MSNKILDIAEALWRDESDRNWKEFVKALPESGIKYYRVVFLKGEKLKKAQDLTKSYAELYDAKEKLVTKIPIFEKKGKKIEGATYYMKGLLTINKVAEWVK